uniref:Transmembrane protein n=1 Tax=viral metagenome TaxID=1070528 RepID=A0A6C0CVE7_9ZZZZ
MVKSTPIAQIIPPQQQQQAITQPPPQQKYQEEMNEDINIEDLVQEKERLSTIQQQQQSDLQNQIDTLKREIEMNKSNIPTPSLTPQQPQTMTPTQPQTTTPTQSQSMTDSFINKNALLSVVGDLDYFLFVVVVFILVVVYSESVRSFIFQKLEVKNLAYLTSYTQALISAILVVLIKKLN